MSAKTETVEWQAWARNQFTRKWSIIARGSREHVENVTAYGPFMPYDVCEIRKKQVRKKKAGSDAY